MQFNNLIIFYIPNFYFKISVEFFARTFREQEIKKSILYSTHFSLLKFSTNLEEWEVQGIKRPYMNFSRSLFFMVFTERRLCYFHADIVDNISTHFKYPLSLTVSIFLRCFWSGSSSRYCSFFFLWSDHPNAREPLAGIQIELDRGLTGTVKISGNVILHVNMIYLFHYFI